MGLSLLVRNIGGNSPPSSPVPPPLLSISIVVDFTLLLQNSKAAEKTFSNLHKYRIKVVINALNALISIQNITQDMINRKHARQISEIFFSS